ncbi:MAG: YidC/Oxa1 family membrane protein insertase [bacterium]
MIEEIWFTFLYQPLFNALVWIYANLAGQNLGWAVILLTIFLRVLLLPLTIKSEMDARRREKVEEKAVNSAKSFKGDFVAQKEAIRETMKKNKVSPWAKFLSLGIQLLVLVLLYQVFIGGIQSRKMVTTLYDWIDYPGKLDVFFYGFDIGARYDYIWAGLVFVYIFTYVLWSNRGKKWDVGKATFLFLFPTFVFFALWFLPMVKSLFILTSMIFSDIIGLLMMPFLPNKKTVDKEK